MAAESGRASAEAARLAAERTLADERALLEAEKRAQLPTGAAEELVEADQGVTAPAGFGLLPCAIPTN